MTPELTGGCSCGRVRWQAEGPVLHRVHCHCTLCRKGSGAIEVPWLTVQRDRFAWTAAPPALYRSTPKGERSFCLVCGSKLTFAHDDFADHIDLAIGSLDDVEAGYPLDQIHGESRVAWLAVDPHLPFRPGHEPTQPIADPPPVPADAALDGGCLCGSFRYRVTGRPLETGLCHCGMCRRATGGLAMAWAIWPRERYRDNAAPLVGWASSDVGNRWFCPTCGTSLLCDAAADPGIVEITIASLDDPHAVAPEAHGFAADAPSWLVIDDRRPRWPAAPNAQVPEDRLLRSCR